MASRNERYRRRISILTLSRNSYILLCVSSRLRLRVLRSAMVQKLELHGDELDSRAREVLREIVMQHVATGEADQLPLAGEVRPLPALAGQPPQRHGRPRRPRLSRAAAHLGRPRPDRPRLPLLHRPPHELAHAHAARARDDRRPGRPRQRDRRSAASRLARPLASSATRSASSSCRRCCSSRSAAWTSSLVAESKIMCVIVGTNGVVVNKIIETRQLVHARRAARRSAATSPSSSAA